jgi:hypothetical protein
MSLNKRIKDTDRKIHAKQKELKKLSTQEKAAIKKWRKEYRVLLKAALTLAGITSLRQLRSLKFSKNAKKVRDFVEGANRAQTAARDQARELMSQVRSDIASLQAEKSLLHEQAVTETKAVDDIVNQVFKLNETVVQASQNRSEYLKQQVFRRVLGDDGKIHNVTFESKDGLQKVVALANRMTLLEPDLAARAKVLIQQFFGRFEKTAPMDKNMKALYELTRELLVEKTDFKVGPNLYRFFSMEFDTETLPELFEAQVLLRRSIKSKTTSSYIRLYKRSNRNEKWEEVAQS